MWEHVQEALVKGTILNDEVAESEQRGILFIRRVSGIPPLFALSYMAEAAHDGVDRSCQFTLANHIGQTCNTSSQSVATPRSLRFPNLPDRGS